MVNLIVAFSLFVLLRYYSLDFFLLRAVSVRLQDQALPPNLPFIISFNCGPICFAL